MVIQNLLSRSFLAGSFAAVVLAASATAQVLVPQAVSGFNEDIVANGTNTSALASTSNAFDSAASPFAFYSSGFQSSTTGAAPTGTGLPASGLITSANGSGNLYQLADFSGPNALVIRSASLASTQPGAATGTLTLANPGAFTQLGLLGTSAHSTTTVGYTLNFDDGLGGVSGTVTFVDWFNGSSPVISGIGRVRRSDDAFETPSGNPRLYERTIDLALADQSRTLVSVDFEFVSGGQGISRAAIFGLSAIPEPSTYALIFGVIVLGVVAFRRRRTA